MSPWKWWHSQSCEFCGNIWEGKINFLTFLLHSLFYLHERDEKQQRRKASLFVRINKMDERKVTWIQSRMYTYTHSEFKDSNFSFRFNHTRIYGNEEKKFRSSESTLETFRPLIPVLCCVLWSCWTIAQSFPHKFYHAASRSLFPNLNRIMLELKPSRKAQLKGAQVLHNKNFIFNKKKCNKWNFFLLSSTTGIKTTPVASTSNHRARHPTCR